MDKQKSGLASRVVVTIREGDAAMGNRELKEATLFFQLPVLLLHFSPNTERKYLDTVPSASWTNITETFTNVEKNLG